MYLSTLRAAHRSKSRVVNDMSIQVATVNGSGSQSSNTVLLRSIFQMGVPVSGKNLFPSNIAGLPTWYTIRANKDGYIARKKEIDFVVAMNSETAQEDVMSAGPGRSRVVRRAPEPQHSAFRSRFLRRSLRQTGRSRLSRGQAAQAGQEHDLRGRGGQVAGDRHCRSRKSHPQAVCQEGESRQPESGRRESRIRLRCRQSGQARSVFHPAHGQDRRQDHYRRQLRRRSGLHVRRRDHGRLVSDHAVVIIAREHDRLHEALPHRRRRQGHVCHRAGGRRTGCNRHGAGRRLGGRARDDCHRPALEFR